MIIHSSHSHSKGSHGSSCHSSRACEHSHSNTRGQLQGWHWHQLQELLQLPSSCGHSSHSHSSHRVCSSCHSSKACMHSHSSHRVYSHSIHHSRACSHSSARGQPQ